MSNASRSASHCLWFLKREFVSVSTLKAGVWVYVIAFRHAHHSDHP